MTKQSTLPRSVVLQKKKEAIGKVQEKAEASEQDVVAASFGRNRNWPPHQTRYEHCRQGAAALLCNPKCSKHQQVVRPWHNLRELVRDSCAHTWCPSSCQWVMSKWLTISSLVSRLHCVYKLRGLSNMSHDWLGHYVKSHIAGRDQAT